jgi:hypothetical protein
MPRPLYATLVVICLASATTAFSQAEKPNTAEWVPFVAKWVQTNETEGWRRNTVVISGIYVRDKQGSWYRRSTARVTHGDLPLAGALDTAYLYQRVDNKLYLIDYTRKTIRASQVKDTHQAVLGGNPMSQQTFEQYRSQDRFLGKQTISGVECEGYAIRDPRHKGKYVAEVWYAPSLNYLAVETKSRPQGDQWAATRVEEIQVGKEPDPQYFRLPDGFKMIK